MGDTGDPDFFLVTGQSRCLNPFLSLISRIPSTEGYILSQAFLYCTTPVKRAPDTVFPWFGALTMNTPHQTLDNPSFYINRELSWIRFNRHVLDEARDDNPAPAGTGEVPCDLCKQP